MPILGIMSVQGNGLSIVNKNKIDGTALRVYIAINILP